MSQNTMLDMFYKALISVEFLLTLQVKTHTARNVDRKTKQNLAAITF